MKLKISLASLGGLMLLMLPCITLATTNPASQEWVMKQISIAVANTQSVLTAAEWNAVCTSGSPAGASGCFGNASSPAFTKLSTGLGGYTTYANIIPANAPNSVFIKAFFAGTNTPASTQYLTVSILGGAARCNLFAQSGMGISPIDGIANQNAGPQAPAPTSINNFTYTAFLYNNNPSIPVVISSPLYLLCVGYNTTDGATATTLTSATAT